MLLDKSDVQAGINIFQRETGCTFDLDLFESRASELEVTKPGQGYKLAYKEALNNICSQLAEKSKTEEDVISVEYAFLDFDSYVMRRYQNSCKNENINLNIQNSFKDDVFADRLSYYEFMKDSINRVCSPMAESYFKFRDGDLSAYEMIEFTRDKKKEGEEISRKDAETIAGYAKAIEIVNKNRPFSWKLTHLITHIVEKFQIREMRKTLEKSCSIPLETLEISAAKETGYVSDQRDDIIDEIEAIKGIETKTLDIEKDVVEFKDLPKKMQIEIELEEQLNTELSPRHEESNQRVRNNTLDK